MRLGSPLTGASDTDTSPAAPSTGRKRLVTAARWLAYAACIGLFVHALAEQDVAAGWARVRSIGLFAVLALLPFPAAMALDAAGWRRLLAAVGPRVPLRVLVRVRVAMEAVNNSTPAGAVWAEAIAPVLVSRRAHAPISDVVAASTAKRWLLVRAHGVYVLGAGVAGIGALSTASRRLVGSDVLVAAVLASGLGLLLVSLLIETVASRGRIGGRVSGALGSARRLAAWIEARRHHFASADAHIARLSRDRRVTRGATAFLLGLWLVEGVETYLILRLLGADLGLAAVMSFDSALSILRSAAVFAPAGIGVQDVGYLAVLDAYGVPDSSGIAPAFVVLKRMKEAFWVIVGFVLLARSKPRKTPAEVAVAQGAAQPPSGAT